MTGSLQRAHAQLRRLRNDSSILKDAYITAIPHHKSKVFFKYNNLPKLTSFRSSTPVGKFLQITKLLILADNHYILFSTKYLLNFFRPQILTSGSLVAP